MVTRKYRAAEGVTLVELMITIIAAIVLTLSLTAILYYGHRNYWVMFRRVNSDVVRNGYEARRLFDRIVRQASVDAEYPDNAIGVNGIYVYYYSDPADISDLIGGVPRLPDKFACFYQDGTVLRLHRGDVPGTVTSLSSWVPPSYPFAGDPSIASNVVSCVFTVKGNSIGMVLTLDNETSPAPGASTLETLKMTVTTSALRHNH